MKPGSTSLAVDLRLSPKEKSCFPWVLPTRIVTARKLKPQLLQKPRCPLELIWSVGLGMRNSVSLQRQIPEDKGLDGEGPRAARGGGWALGGAIWWNSQPRMAVSSGGWCSPAYGQAQSKCVQALRRVTNPGRLLALLPTLKAQKAGIILLRDVDEQVPAEHSCHHATMGVVADFPWAQEGRRTVNGYCHGQELCPLMAVGSSTFGSPGTKWMPGCGKWKEHKEQHAVSLLPFLVSLTPTLCPWDGGWCPMQFATLVAGPGLWHAG